MMERGTKPRRPDDGVDPRLATVGPHDPIVGQALEHRAAFQRATVSRLADGRHSDDVAEAALWGWGSSVLDCFVSGRCLVEEVSAVDIVRQEYWRHERRPPDVRVPRQLGDDLRAGVSTSHDDD